MVMTLIPAEPATPAWIPMAAPSACVEKSFACVASGMRAVTLTPAALIVSPKLMVAVLVTVAMFKETAAPIESVFLVALASPKDKALLWFVVPTVSEPPAVTVRPPSISAIVLVVMTFTETAAAMPTFVAPVLPPDWLLAELEGEVNSLLDVGGAATSGESEPPSLCA